MKIEKAIFADGISQLKEFDLSKYDRLYLGHETCERMLPSIAEIKQAKKICEKNSLAFSLVSPFCTNSGLKSLLPLIKKLSRDDELIANDFGVLYAVSKKPKARLVCGRLFNRQYRDPRIAFFKNAPAEMMGHLRSSHASSDLFKQLMEKFNVQRIELDNLLQGIGTNLHGADLKGSLYYPLVFVSATRFCLAANCDKLSHANKIGIFPCNRDCRNYSFKLENSEFPKPLYIFGNAIYFENKKIPNNTELAKQGIDRLVFTAKTPLSEE